MKKLTLSLAAVAAMGTFAVAGGDIAPVEPVVETPAVVAPVNTDAGFYVGAAYGLLNAEVTATTIFDESYSVDENFNEFMVLAGYKINQYVAIEGRYWFGASDDIVWDHTGERDTSVDAWGVYVKPMYPVTDAFDIYALIGYGSADMTVKDPNSDFLSSANGEEDGFSWGIGGSYDVNENLAVFVDWVRIYDDTITYQEWANTDIDKTVDSLNFGMTYKF